MTDANRLSEEIYEALAKAEDAGLSLEERISELELILMALREQENE